MMKHLCHVLEEILKLSGIVGNCRELYGIAHEKSPAEYRAR